MPRDDPPVYVLNGISYPYFPAGPGDLRSPCPGLNSLANHGILPRNGSNIPPEVIRDAIKAVYNISHSFSDFIVGQAQGCCSTPNQTGLDLNAIAAHGKMEHDASLAHHDADGAEFAPTTVDAALLADVLSRSPTGLTLRDIAQIRVDREAILTQPLATIQQLGATLEAGLFYTMLKDDAGVVSNELARVWLGEERIPEGFVTPAEEVTLQGGLGVGAIINATMAEIRGI
ncbi:Chloroperoxidase [Mycena rebaudengoi]|nr:Chloroperoxidase [Mycena rebaudengoi]